MLTAAVHADAVLARRLGVVHRHVGLDHQILDGQLDARAGLRRGPEQGHPHRAGHLRAALAMVHDAVVPDLRQQLLGDPARLHLVGLRKDHRKLVTTGPGHHVGLAQTAADGSRQLHDEAVAGGVPERVVDELEPVEVERQQRPAGPVAVGPREGQLELDLKAATVVQAGQRVVVGEVAQLALKALALRDVERLLDHEPLAAAAEQQRVGDHRRDLLSVGAEEAPLELRPTGAAVGQAAERQRERALAVVRVNPPGQVATVQCAELNPEHLGVGGVRVKQHTALLALEPDERHRDPSLLEDDTEPCLGGGTLRLQADLRGDVLHRAGDPRAAGRRIGVKRAARVQHRLRPAGHEHPEGLVHRLAGPDHVRPGRHRPFTILRVDPLGVPPRPSLLLGHVEEAQELRGELPLARLEVDRPGSEPRERLCLGEPSPFGHHLPLRPLPRLVLEHRRGLEQPSVRRAQAQVGDRDGGAEDVPDVRLPVETGATCQAARIGGEERHQRVQGVTAVVDGAGEEDQRGRRGEAIGAQLSGLQQTAEDRPGDRQVAEADDAVGRRPDRPRWHDEHRHALPARGGVADRAASQPHVPVFEHRLRVVGSRRGELECARRRGVLPLEAPYAERAARSSYARRLAGSVARPISAFSARFRALRPARGISTPASHSARQ